MPELPDIDVYVARIEERVAGSVLSAIRFGNPFFLRSVNPPVDAVAGKAVDRVRRIGKRIAIGLEDDLWLVIHLMIAGRLRWHDTPPAIRGRHMLATLDFNSGSLAVTEAGTRKRASLHIACGDDALRQHDTGGLEPLACTQSEFAERLQKENRTLKRALTNPRAFSGIGNAYSDEILHAAGLSPARLTGRLSEEEIRRLHAATVTTLTAWRDRLLAESAAAFPVKVTAFRPDMAAHGKFGQPCPKCGNRIARIRYKDNETNYCPTCQTGGRLLADRSLSRLLKDDWPDSL